MLEAWIERSVNGMNDAKGLLKNKFLNFAPRFGSDLAWLD